MNIDSGQNNQLPWTGERYIPEITGEIQLEHVHRYLLAAEYAKNKDVLDIACGEGFGSAILAKTARSVVGVDIAVEAIQHAALRYRMNNVRFQSGACAEIPLDNDSIDLVVSFETLEHHDQHNAMMIEIKRVLRQEGVLIISTPDKKEYSVLPNYRNPFHVRELFKEEFEDLIRAHFKYLAIISQRIVYGSAVLPETGAFPFTDCDIKETDGAHPGLLRPRYLIAFASNEALPALSGGLLEQSLEESETAKLYAAENERRSEVTAQVSQRVHQLEGQLQSQAAQSADQMRQLQEQHYSQAAQSAGKVGQLQEQLYSQACQSADKVGQLQEQLHARALQSAGRVGQLQEQLHSQACQSADQIRQLQEQLHAQASQSADKVGQLQDKLQSQASQFADKVCQLEEQLQAQTSQSADNVRLLEKQLQAQASQAVDNVRLLEKQLRTQASQSADNVCQLEEQLRSQASQSADNIHQLQEQVKQLNLALHESRNLGHRMSRSLSWRLTWPLRVIRDAGAKTLHRKLRRAKSPLRWIPKFLVTAFRMAPNATEQSLNPHVTHIANLVRASDLFDANAYDAAASARAHGFDPALHYVLVGEEQGFKPSPAFDPIYYGKIYPDVVAWGGNRLGHYLEAGRAEGRRALPIANTLELPLIGIDPAKRTVLVLIHEASRTGAPILGWNIVRELSQKVNVVTILGRDGQLKKAFTDVAAAVVGPLGNDILDPAETAELAHRLTATYRPLYVIANSVETRALVSPLAEEGVPTVVLAHEFSGYSKPSGSLRPLYERAAEIVFPADLVRRASEADYPFLTLLNTHVLPQGPSLVPRSRLPLNDPRLAEAAATIRSRLRPEGAQDDLLVVGMGFVDWRKGVDLFIATATAILAPAPNTPVRFVWIGEGYRNVDAVDVSCYLSEQVNRSRLGNRFAFMEAVEDIESVYQEADVLFLSSRLDPLPNVSIDATLRGIPVVCFADASGMAEILASSEETRELVLAHLDVGSAAALIGSLATDRHRLQRLGDAVRRLAQTHFDLVAYVATLDELGRLAAQRAQQRETDAELILSSGAFDPPLYLGERAPFVEPAAAVRQYLALADKYNYARLPLIYQPCTRRPMAGFHPIAYALQSPNYRARVDADPLAHYLRSGRPAGPWAHSVLRVDPPENMAPAISQPDAAKLRVVLHGHFHYTEHVSDLLRALAANVQRCELILTTSSSEKATEIGAALREFQAEADIRVVPNRGRDIGPFLGVLNELKGHCDLLGHIHGKRSPHVDPQFASLWRIFLWQHLIGDQMPMVDIITQAFIDDQTLGLVFPEDPFLIGWDKNLAIAQKLAARMEIRAPLPINFESPIGTMFWTRPEALEPLLRLELTWDDYPNEPVPIDGTILHALERLLVPVAKDAGYHYATTYLPLFVR